ncbi:Cas1p-domain-containing protein [Mollisia scopiformis]|uniref:Cas1p-domain-containing protein n=1 Tax=Mollisia scopiformis TaxID=149040 RepID=A0A194WXL9_MOLSC|nr:Cas1p-domain-containing protein [Mollisia scopiformis]KUJ12728.1 Cas1p-domain-containing protein [Mollisia scopiformis]
MVRPTVKARSTSDQITAIVERILQGTLAFVILWVVYRYCWIDVSDPFKCGALLHKGQWLDPGPRWSPRNPFQNWQPPGCIMHEYKRRDIHECFHNRRIVFIGDSTTRQIFWAVAKKMDQEKADEAIADVLAHDEKHNDLAFETESVSVQFIWDPFLNSTGLDRELTKFSAVPSLEPTGASGESAALLLLGSPGLWFARHEQENFMKDFRDSIEHVIPYMDHGHGDEDALPPRRFNAREASPNLLLLAPIQVPQYEVLSPSRAATITPEKIDQMNDFLQQASAYSEADVVWSYNLMTWSGKAQYEESGLHVVDNVAHRKADVLLNLRCNAGPASSKYPFDRTCCSNYTQPNYVQWIMILAGMLVLPLLLSLRRAHVAWLSRFLPSTQTLTTWTIFCLVLCLSYYADRTQIFEKSQRQFRRKEFMMACSAVAIAGLVSIKKNKDPPAIARESRGLRDQPFLSRQQTEEWKGWMQAIILIYHYTHGSKTLWIYEIVRLLIASYLFMTGFGHATYFLKTGDYSIRRAAGVLVRLNLLSCVLPYMMRTDYMFYYFGSLVSFWFLVIYLTLRIAHVRNSDQPFLFGKMVLSAAAVTCFIKIPGILETVSFVLNKTCAVTWPVMEWRFRISLDLYIVYVGMVLAALTVRRSQLRVEMALPGNLLDTLIKASITYRGTFNFVAAVLSTGLLPGFWSLTRRSPDKQDYNWWQPYISFIPILSFVTLRNCHHLLRNYHSVVFAWLGRCSLETYILQYHIWLAGDTKGLLSLGLGPRWLDAFILTPIFLWISWHTSKTTQMLTGWVVGSTKFTRMSSEDIPAGEKDSPYLIPKTQNRGSSDMEDIALERQKTGARSCSWKTPGKVEDEIKWKLGVILLLMWLANVTYR